MALQQRQAQPYTPNRFFDPDEDFAPASATAPAPGAPPQPGDVAANVPQPAPAAGAQPAPSLTPAPDPMSSPAAFHAPTQADYTKANMPARPVGDFDKIPAGQPGADTWANRHNNLRRGLAAAFAGLAEYGGQQNHNPGQGARFVDRWMGQDEAQRQYDANQGRNQAAATVAGSGQQIGQAGQQADVNLKNAEAQRVPWEMHKAMDTQKANAISQILQEKESGKFGDDVLLSRWQRIARANPTLGITDKDISDAISGTKSPQPVFKSSNGTIEPLTYQGQNYGLQPTPGEPAEVSSARDNALKSLQVEQLAKLNPIVRGQLGEPPSDPHQLAAYMKKAEEITTRMSAAPRIEMQNQRAVQVGDPNTGAVTYEHAGDAIKNKDQAPGSIGFSAQKTAANAVAKGEVPKNIGDQKVAFNTAISHADLLQKAADALKNGDQQTLNSLSNRFANEFGSAGQVNAQAIANAYSREVTKMLSGGHLTDSEIGATGKTLDPNSQSPEQIKGVLETYKSLAQSKLKNLTDQESAALHRGSQPSAAQQGGDNPPPQALSALQEGHETTFANGQVWTKQNGQPKRVR